MEVHGIVSIKMKLLQLQMKIFQEKKDFFSCHKKFFLNKHGTLSVKNKTFAR